MKWKFIFYGIVLPIHLSLEDDSCVSQHECNSGIEILCGICVDSATPAVGLCIFPFSLVYKPDKSCSKVTVCGDNNCGGHGECKLTSANNHEEIVPSCKCNEGFYGWACENEASKDYSGTFFPYIEFPFESVLNPVESHVRKINLFCGWKQSVSQGFLEVVSARDAHYHRNEINRNLCEKGKWVHYQYEIRYPYIPLIWGSKNNVVSRGNVVLGYISSYQVTVTMRGTVNYQHEFPVFVSYNKASLECVPVVKILGCGSSKGRGAATRQQEVLIQSYVTFVADGRYTSTTLPKPYCANRATYLWKVWKNQDSDSAETFQTFVSSHELKFGHFTLDIGNYRILLEVTSVQEKPSVNYDYCYLNVVYEPLVAIIDGGSERVVQKRFDVVLQTTRSTDPNMPSHSQGHMKASWSCVDISDHYREICDPTQILPVSNSHTISSEKLRFGAELQITLKVWTDYYKNCETCGNVKPVFAFATITVANKSAIPEDDINIQCLLNCKVKVDSHEQLYLKVKTRSGSYSENYVWTYYEKGQGKEESTENIIVQGLPSFMLVVKQNSFSIGTNYTIVLKNKKEVMIAKYSFETLDVRFEGNCSMNPMNGIRGLTLFNMVCENFTANGNLLLFEFYDKTSKEAEEGLVFSGRMMGTSTDGELRDFRVTRGNVFVYIKDDSGYYTHEKFIVNLSNWNVSEEGMDEVFHNISESKDRQDFEKMIEYISIIPDVISTELNKSKILERLLPFVIDFPTKKLSDVKITSSTLNSIILALNKPAYLEMESGLMSTVVNIVRKQAELLSSTVIMGTDLRGMSSDEIKHLAMANLNVLRAIVMCKDQRTVGVKDFDLDIETEDKLINISNSAEEIIYYIQNVLTFLQKPGLPPINITSEDNAYVVWAITNDEDYDLTNYWAKGKDVPVIVTKHFVKELENPIMERQEVLSLCVATIDNIFWWRRSDVRSSLVSVSLTKHSQNKRIRKIKYVDNPLDVQINLNGSLLNTTEISDVTFQYQHNVKCSLDLDMAVKIHRLDPAPNSLITLRFLYPKTNGSMQVLIYKNRRPDCDVMKRAVSISEQSPIYPPVLFQQNDPAFFYVGIIAGPNYTNDSVKYTFQVNTTVCQHWDRSHWSAHGCKISTRTEGLKVHCNCDHFSIFAAAFPIPPQEIDPFSDISLFLTVFNNPIVVVFVSVVLLVYLIACLWAFCKDRGDRTLRDVVVLSDNFPGDHYPYLLAVYTSSRFNAGTTAHVGIKVIGSLATSRAHILASPERKTLKRNYDDWFLIYYSQPLGDLRYIHIWHDNAGSSPDWFCDKIVVYDLKEKVDAVFVVEQWIALRLNCYPEASVPAATISQVKNVKRMFVDNCVLGLREGHILLSIVLRHPRSTMSRLQKVSVLMCSIMIAMLCSIMFYSPKVDQDNYNVSMRDFYISVQSLLISSAVTFLVLFAFKNSYKYTYQRSRSTTLYKTIGFQEYDALEHIHHKKTFYATYVRFVSKRLKGHPMEPVQLANTERNVRRRNICFVLAWTSCIAVIVTCSFLVMLYGLKLGLVKSKMWLSSVLFSVFEELLIVGPLKIIILSVLLSLAFQKMSETSSHQVYVEDALKVTGPAEAEQYEKTFAKRNHQMYAPLRHDAIDEMIRKKEWWEKLHTVFDFVISLFFLMVLSVVIYELWSSHYYINRHVNNIVTQPHFSRTSESFSAIKDVPQMEKYLEHSLIRSLYIRSWYNKMPIIEEGYWMEDFTLRKVGVERLRQIRVTPVSCTFTFINTTRRCIPRWDSSREDNQDYSVGWRIAQWHDLQANNSPWKYTQSRLGTLYTMYRLYGGSDTLYHDGGYLTYLGPQRSTTEAEIATTISNNWQDQLTKAVFVEFTLFNTNNNLFSQVTIIVEYLISGTIKLKADVVSVESQIKPSVWNTLAAAFIIYYVARSGNLINRRGLMEYLASSRNRTQVFVIVVGAFCYTVATIHYFLSADQYHMFLKGGQNSFFDFDSFVYCFLLLQGLLSFLFCLAIFRSMLIISHGRILENYFFTFTMAASSIVYVTVIILSFQLLQLHWMFLLYIHSFHSFAEILINPKFFKTDEHEDENSGVFFFVKSLIASLMLRFYFVFFAHTFRIVRTRRFEQSGELYLTDCILNKVCKRRKTQRN